MSNLLVINVGWFTNSTDLETAVICIKCSKEFWAAPAMDSVRVGEEELPGRI
jgi:hypothetical protein